ncbi:MAG: flagellar rod assembly protein FlgJ [Xanthobacteraceae bacterium]|nr:MAG: flagellar rod assembly protein FlgJ [Xanthobacteraceae bacterium]
MAASVAKTPMIGNRPDIALMNALTKVSPQGQAKAKANAQDFEAVFLNSMFQQMFSGVQGDGPMGSTTGTGAWRSMLVDEHSKSFAKAGGVGVSDDVYRTLILQQAARGG